MFHIEIVNVRMPDQTTLLDRWIAKKRMKIVRWKTSLENGRTSKPCKLMEKLYMRGHIWHNSSDYVNLRVMLGYSLHAQPMLRSSTQAKSSAICYKYHINVSFKSSSISNTTVDGPNKSLRLLKSKFWNVIFVSQIDHLVGYDEYVLLI